MAQSPAARILTLADSWPLYSLVENRYRPQNQARNEKLEALIPLLRSHWTQADHICHEYMDLITETDPQLIVVALLEQNPIGVPSKNT